MSNESPLSDQELEELRLVAQELEEASSLEDTYEGELLNGLKELAAAEGKTASIDQGDWGRYLFHYGDEAALLQNHVSQGVNYHYVNMLDLQKPWWKKTFLDGMCKGNLRDVGLIAPSVFDVIKASSGQDVIEKFKLSNILKAIGAKSTKATGDEFSEQEVLSEGLSDESSTLIAKMVEYWQQLIGPEFEVKFDNGNGDLFRKIRLMPINAETSNTLCYGGPKFEEATKKITDDYDGLIDHLKSQ